jgi:hypothetical protein
VFVYDYAKVSPATLKGAQGVSSEIFKRAGLELEWADCAVQGSKTQAPHCSKLTAIDVQMRVLNAPMAKTVGTNSFCLGYALVPLRDVLGAAMAHEIGHLLLAQAGHTSDGLMRPVWDKTDLTSLARGRLLFSESQARRMSNMAAKRVEERARRAYQQN